MFVAARWARALMSTIIIIKQLLLIGLLPTKRDVAQLTLILDTKNYIGKFELSENVRHYKHIP